MNVNRGQIKLPLRERGCREFDVLMQMRQMVRYAKLLQSIISLTIHYVITGRSTTVLGKFGFIISLRGHPLN